MDEAPHQKHDSAAEDQSASLTDTLAIQHPILATIQRCTLYLFCGAFGLIVVTVPLAILLRIAVSYYPDLWFTVWWLSIITVCSCSGVLLMISWIDTYFYRQERTYSSLFWAIAAFLLTFVALYTWRTS